MHDFIDKYLYAVMQSVLKMIFTNPIMEHLLLLLHVQSDHNLFKPCHQIEANNEVINESWDADGKSTSLVTIL